MTEHESGHDQPGDSGRAAHRPDQAADQPGPSAAGTTPTAAATTPAAAGTTPDAAGHRPPTAQQLPASKGFVASLFDFGFVSFVTPKVVKVLYPLIMILAALGALVFVAISFRLGTPFGLFALFILAPLYFLIVIAFYRITMELFIVLFRIADDIPALRQRGDIH